jgi:hypothetical protein
MSVMRGARGNFHTSSTGVGDMAFQQDETSNWSEFRKLPNHREIDFHWAGADNSSFEHWRDMAEVSRITLRALQEAHRAGVSYVLLLHGCSEADGDAQTTARSVIRGLMRGKTAAPYIVRSRCIQHHSCFVAAIRPLKSPLKSVTPAPPIDLRNARLYRRRQTSPPPLREAHRR